MGAAPDDSHSAYPAPLANLLDAVLAVLDPCVAVVAGGGNLIAANSAWRHLTFQNTDQSAQSEDTAFLLDERFPASMPVHRNRRRVEGLQSVLNGNQHHFACDFATSRGRVHSWYRVDAHHFDQPPGKAIFIVHDISGRKQAEVALRTSQDQLYQSQKMEALGTLVAGMAHEINNPTSLIMFNLPIVKRVWQDVLPLLKFASQDMRHAEFGGYKLAFLENQFHQLIVDMELAASRISKIVKDLRNFSRQSQIADKGPIDINAAVTAAVRLARTTIRKSGVELTLHLAENLPKINGNLTGIEQVVLNVIINAIQAIDHDRGCIAIETGHRPTEGCVYIAVQDNGGGISPEVADKLFDPFVTDKQGQGGTGLGLAVSYNLVQAHDGRIDYADADEGGAIFTVTLPVEPRRRLPRVLVVDDDAMVRQLVVQALSQTGRYHIDEAANGVDGLIKIGTHPPDLLILDLMMPGMNGLEVCQAIHGKEPFAAMKVIITTGHPHHPDLKQITALGFTEIHPKPIKIETLRAIIAAILN